MDVKVLLRIAVVYNIPIACNRSSADFIKSSHLVEEVCTPVLKDYSAYIDRAIQRSGRLMGTPYSNPSLRLLLRAGFCYDFLQQVTTALRLKSVFRRFAFQGT